VLHGLALGIVLVTKAQRSARLEQSPLPIEHQDIDELVSARDKLDSAASHSVNAALVRKYEHFARFRIPSLASGNDSHVFGLQHVFNP
jgi:hypothetical protein